MSRAQSCPTKNSSVQFLVRMEEVTDRLAAGRTQEIVRKAEAEGKGYKAAVEQMYYGNQQFLFVYEQFDDVRLVAAPPSSIGKFGGDTDNWIWPRHTGDFSLFRIYAGKGQQTRGLFARERTLQTQEAFQNLDRRVIGEGDFTMIYGFPGNTQEYILSGRRGLHRRAFRPGEDRRPHGPSRHHHGGAADRSGAAHPLRRQARLDRQRLEEMAGRSAGHQPAGHRRLEARLREDFAAWAQDKPEYRRRRGRPEGRIRPHRGRLLRTRDHRETLDALPATLHRRGAAEESSPRRSDRARPFGDTSSASTRRCPVQYQAPGSSPGMRPLQSPEAYADAPIFSDVWEAPTPRRSIRCARGAKRML